MLRSLIVGCLLLSASTAGAVDDVEEPSCECNATPAACDATCSCDLECEIDWTADECAEPGAGCFPETPDLDDATLAAAEIAAATDADELVWPIARDQVACPDGATNVDGRCVPHDDVVATEVTGSCSSGNTAIAVPLLALTLVLMRRRRRGLIVITLVACSLDGGGWDEAVEAGPTGDSAAYLDVFAAALGDGDGAQLLLANQPLAAGAEQPVAQISLSRLRTGLPMFRIAGAIGDRITTERADGAELLGWARSEPGDGTAELVELQAPDGAFVYETHDEAIDELVAQGFAITSRLGYVWPPGWADEPVVDLDPMAELAEEVADPLAAPAPCNVNKRSALVLLYASPGSVETLRFLKGCPGEVVVGEKKEKQPGSSMKTAAAHAAGGRTAFVIDNHGYKMRDLLLRTNGVERTAAYIRKKLNAGYDYIVIDEITAAPEWRDGATANRRLRKLLLRLPPRTIIPYISIDLTQYATGYANMKARRLLLRAFKRRARTIGLEVYLHTAQVMNGAAPSAFRRAADRLALSVRGLKYGGGINLRAITVIGTSMHSTYPQYRYLDWPKHDLVSIKKQVNAIRHGSKRLRQQNGVGYYYVNKSDMAPRSGAPYSYDGLIRRMRLQARRFR